MKRLNFSIQNNSYFILCCILFTTVIRRIIRGDWGGDFWTHAAAIRELSAHPLFPKHPQLLLNAPDITFNPYTILLASLSRWFHINVVTILSIFAIINFLLFVYGLRFFISQLFSKQITNIASLSLLFILLLWGNNPWFFSGFYHLRVFSYVMPYPSTFSFSLVLITLSLFSIYLTNNKFWLFALVVGMAMIIAMSHPFSFITFCAGIIAICVEKGWLCFHKNMLCFILGFSIFFIVVLLWPYFPMLSLLNVNVVEAYKNAQVVMYVDVLPRTYPALLGLPFLFLLAKEKPKHPLITMFVLLMLVYAAGAIFHKEAIGRVMSSLVFILHISLAYGLVHYVPILKQKLSTRLLVTAKYVGYFFIVSLMLFAGGLGLKKNIFKFSNVTSTAQEYSFLPKYVKEYDVVLSDISTSWVVPTFAGKVIAVLMPSPFVPSAELEQRATDLSTFFNKNTTFNIRESIIKKYHVRFLLFNKMETPNWEMIAKPFITTGTMLFNNEKYVLISVA